jgi:hypothetical protein
MERSIDTNPRPYAVEHTRLLARRLFAGALELWRRPFVVGWCLVAAGAAYYLIAMGVGPLELPLVALGLAALWLPLGALFYDLLRTEIADGVDRLTFASLASLSLTTLCYFGCAELHVGFLFYAMQAGLLGRFLWRFLSPRGWRVVQNWWQAIRTDLLNPILPLIVVGSLITCIKYNTYLHEQPDGSALLVTYHDNTYQAGQAYELARHIPPRQNAVRAGQPERAYHCFPQVTIGLIGRFTLQGDLMRADLVYRHSVLEALTCLTLFCLGRWLSGCAGGGYLAASLMFIIVYPFPAFIPSYLNYYFFTVEPHVSSFLEPIVITMTQGLCSVPLVYAISLGLLIAGGRVRSGQPVAWLPLILGLMTAAEMRFRVQVFAPLVPGFLVLMVYFWIRSRKWSFALAIGACLLVSALLQLEMRSAAYLKSSSEVLLTLNGLAKTFRWMNLWPFHREILRWLLQRLGRTAVLDWTWQVVCLTAFVCLNICGIPMMIAVLVYLARSKSWTDHLPLTVIMLSLAIGSLAGGILLNTTYDNYSLGGEMLVNVCVYGFPVYCLLIWQIVNWFWSKWSPSPRMASRLVFAVLVLGVSTQYAFPVTELRAHLSTAGATRLSPAVRGALSYLHDQTPAGSVVASATQLNPRVSVYSGVGGRACYLEYLNQQVVDMLPGVITTEERSENLLRIWSAQSDDQMRRALDATPINYLVEFSDRPLSMRPQGCLRRAWEGSDPDGRKVSIWEVLRPVSSK